MKNLKTQDHIFFDVIAKKEKDSAKKESKSTQDVIAINAYNKDKKINE